MSLLVRVRSHNLPRNSLTVRGREVTPSLTLITITLEIHLLLHLEHTLKGKDPKVKEVDICFHELNRNQGEPYRDTCLLYKVLEERSPQRTDDRRVLRGNGILGTFTILCATRIQESENLVFQVLRKVPTRNPHRVLGGFNPRFTILM